MALAPSDHVGEGVTVSTYILVMYAQYNRQEVMLVHANSADAYSKLLMKRLQTVQPMADGLIFLGQQF